MSELYPSKGNTALDFVVNLKLAIASTVFKTKLVTDSESSVLLLNKKTGFELVEPNAIVKYLAKDFSTNELLSLEETTLYPLLKSKKDIAGEIASVKFDKVDAKSPTQIILFSALYQSKPETAWFKEFSELANVAAGVKLATSITTLERPRVEHTGARKVKSGFIVNKQDKFVLPKPDERNILITSAIPYVNNVPHLGNIIGSVLSADIYSRYTKNRNYNAIYMCGTDEYGTATETKALEEKITPQELCDKYHKLHKEVYDWFEIGFDHFGRTPTNEQTEIAQDIFTKLNENNFLVEKTTEQLYCESHNAFLADRFVEGTCPHCAFGDARGDQCDKCGLLLDPLQLIDPRCKVEQATPVIRESTHIYIKLDELEDDLKVWVAEAEEKGAWSKNSKTITNSWLKKGLDARCITRDLSWGTPVPLKGYEKKVLYVWFDAPIGYISITANYLKANGGNVADWIKWWKNPENVDLYQFMGKDNVAFHTVVFPSSCIGTGEKYTLLHHLNTTEYLQYETGKFSKSRGVGVFGNNAKDTGIPPSVWRYYLALIRPETSDSQFSWDEFVGKNNNELLANLGNFVNRLVKFVNAKYNGVIPEFDPKHIPNYSEFVGDVNQILANYIDTLEAVSLRRGLEIAMSLSSRGNVFLQENKLDNSLYSNTPDKSDAVVGVGLNLVYLVSALISPYMPSTTQQINEILNAPPLSTPDKFELILEPGHNIGQAQYLFKRIDEKKVEEWKKIYGGEQVK